MTLHQGEAEPGSTRPHLGGETPEGLDNSLSLKEQAAGQSSLHTHKHTREFSLLGSSLECWPAPFGVWSSSWTARAGSPRSQSCRRGQDRRSAWGRELERKVPQKASYRSPAGALSSSDCPPPARLCCSMMAASRSCTSLTSRWAC